ncbi:MAG: hypothetical protein RBR69_02925 [Candidatus Cloacimonadaceae bacterium]|jgi:hypothetical protein|nr:hypothetical protein [Candidatus Cloacimonadota bacterium]MDY0127070.1 hypothetical protein [Candidatus Cloacimonadaceae bacterium]MCB5254749.1 hypothetical protein [Candidatus Cloacimonadota bacterium]MCK9177876.1 hypothetical protein [Candidatus Cloacimonadota bacterium]MCK9242701.1 hypothetical protein [Candidatus Cloacimonadota bacterium]
MQFRFVKDLAIALIVILLGVLIVRLVFLNQKVAVIPETSVHIQESVTDTLMSRIRTIENSIQDRKNFVFSARKDPLRQGNIIKDNVDRLKEFEEMVRNTFRLATTAIDEYGNKIAYVEYQDNLHEVREGEIVAGRKILEINDKNIRYSMGGKNYTANLMPRPELKKQDLYIKSGISGNW